MTSESTRIARARAQLRTVAESYAVPAPPTGPTRTEQQPCFLCAGRGWIETRLDALGHGLGHHCGYCGGSGHIYVDVDA